MNNFDLIMQFYPSLWDKNHLNYHSKFYNKVCYHKILEQINKCEKEHQYTMDDIVKKIYNFKKKHSRREKQFKLKLDSYLDGPGKFWKPSSLPWSSDVGPRRYKSELNDHLIPQQQQVLPVIVSTQAEDQVLESKRSVDFETLIGSHLLLSTASNVFAKEGPTPTDMGNKTVPLSSNEPKADKNIFDQITAQPATMEDKDLASRVIPILKNEPQDETHDISLDTDNYDIKIETPEKEMVVSEEDTSARLGQLSPDFCNDTAQSSLFKCARCLITCQTLHMFKIHIGVCFPDNTMLRCAHCNFETEFREDFYFHYGFVHANYMNDNVIKSADKTETHVNQSDAAKHLSLRTESVYICGVCDYGRIDVSFSHIKNHLKNEHNTTDLIVSRRIIVEHTVNPLPRKQTFKRRLAGNSLYSPIKHKRKHYSSKDLDNLKLLDEQILDEWAYCAECDFNTKVRLDLIRHLQQHVEKRHMALDAVPLNQVPHLELDISSIEGNHPVKTSIPDETDIALHLQKLQPKMGSSESENKTGIVVTTACAPFVFLGPISSPVSNLNLVKKECPDPEELILDEADGTLHGQTQQPKMGSIQSEVKTRTEATPDRVPFPFSPLGPISFSPISDSTKVKEELTDLDEAISDELESTSH